jgi:hypothetical protein
MASHYCELGYEDGKKREVTDLPKMQTQTGKGIEQTTRLIAFLKL